MLAPEDAGRDPDQTLESHAQIFNVSKSAVLRNDLKAEVRIDQKGFHPGDSDIEDFVMRAVAQDFFEARLQQTARLRVVVEHVFHVYSFTGVLTDVADDFGDVTIFYRKHVGGLAGYHA
jgi:hypothetical protein